MISTIGSLVQETSQRTRWRCAAGLHCFGCIGASIVLGAALGLIGAALPGAHCRVESCSVASFSQLRIVAVGVIATVYALSDFGLVRVPRPIIMNAVPVTWWRWWRPYGASLAYGVSLGFGITTQIPFAAFYVISAVAVLAGNPIYGVALLGAYGTARALGFVFMSRKVYAQCAANAGATSSRDRVHERLCQLSAQQDSVRLLIAAMLIAFGLQLLLFVFL